MGRRATILAALLLPLAAVAAEPFDWTAYTWLPPPPVPADNPMSEAKVTLGRRLFYDPRLSADGSLACAGCHLQALAFTDGRARPVGVTGETAPRNAMSLANAGYLPALTWADPDLASLEAQARVPLLGEHPVELGMAGREAELAARLGADPAYPPLFAAAFPDGDPGIDTDRIIQAIATFERVLISASSPYDRYRYFGDEAALSAEAKRGEALFFSSRLHCYRCHRGINLTDNLRHDGMRFPETGYHRTGIADSDAAVRTPGLRNVALTAPYMHDGSLATLEAVIARYAAGGRDLPGKSPEIAGFAVTAAETADLVAFLRSLTDQRFTTDPRFADPFRHEPVIHP